LAQNKPALTRHHQVEHDEVEPADLDRVHHFTPIGRLSDPEAVFAQVFPHERAKLTIVVDNQDVTGGACVQEPAPNRTNSGRN
jgi:hypothetical protein